eukprot:CAMPEP_0202919066 /NCGR_PEP_ID=MMETSP1392-20130828/74952_1 /ASSEMBLY_ACC=CAM_ASM_000868 /TAXON_ID=225041 /ORGANISM="Chlamydomonas chlamydogama, Strain SAG 11-48b" /LENGTH=85 /DNA_ID=CAMNT_0049612289 /DNA_START=9 /DNA_END=266 /DNA_ORIENTATION=+
MQVSVHVGNACGARLVVKHVPHVVDRAVPMPSLSRVYILLLWGATGSCTRRPVAMGSASPQVPQAGHMAVLLGIRYSVLAFNGDA